MLLTKDRIVSLFFLVVAFIFLFFIKDIKIPSNSIEPGSRILPYISIGLMVICCLGMFFESFKKRHIQEKPFLSIQGWKRLLFILGVLIIYSIGLTFLGFVISTPFMAYTLINMLSGKNRISVLTTIIAALVITASIYLLFSVGFNVMLPSGALID